MPGEPYTNATLVADNLTKVIGKRTIVESISFTLQPGEVFGFLGPNGAGKTTTIRMLVGLIKPTAGNVTVCGYDIRKNFEEAMRNVGCIVENPDLSRFMTGRENLEHFARMLGAGRAEIERVAGLVALAHRLDQRVGTYSLGMRQRLGIAQAMLGRPRLLILDEPANGLDPAGIREIRELLGHLAHELRLAVFVSSHLLAEVELMCDRVAIIHKGRILKTGPVRELISSRRVVEIRADDAERASALLREHGIDASIHAQQRMQTLEELFLETTGGETVD